MRSVVRECDDGGVQFTGWETDELRAAMRRLEETMRVLTEGVREQDSLHAVLDQIEQSWLRAKRFADALDGRAIQKNWHC